MKMREASFNEAAMWQEKYVSLNNRFGEETVERKR